MNREERGVQHFLQHCRIGSLEVLVDCPQVVVVIRNPPAVAQPRIDGVGREPGLQQVTPG